MSAWDLVTQSEQENIAKKNGYMLPGNEKKKNLDIYEKKKEVWKLGVVREARMTC